VGWVVSFFFQYLRFGDQFVVFVKRQLADQKRVEDDAQTPHVHLFSRIFLALEHLGRAVANGATPCLQIVGLPFVLARETKIDQLYIPMLVQQNVLELQVAVDARLVVDIGDGADELGEDALNFEGLDGALFQDVVVEFVAWAVLEHQPDQALGDYDLV
jgi:uncharacterized membrane protein YccF (DUF307 family)